MTSASRGSNLCHDSANRIRTSFDRLGFIAAARRRAGKSCSSSLFSSTAADKIGRASFRFEESGSVIPCSRRRSLVLFHNFARRSARQALTLSPRRTPTKSLGRSPRIEAIYPPSSRPAPTISCPSLACLSLIGMIIPSLMLVSIWLCCEPGLAEAPLFTKLAHGGSNARIWISDRAGRYKSP